MKPVRPPKTDEQTTVRTNPDEEWPSGVTEKVDYGFPDEDEEPEPIPVYQVSPPPDAFPRKLWNSSNYLIKDTAQRIVGARRSRYSVAIVNHDATDDVFIGPEMGVLPNVNGKIAAGASIELTHNGSIWAVCSSGLTAALSIFEEYQAEEDD